MTPPRTPCQVDLHAHFFNGYDLPVAGFIRYAARPTKRDFLDRRLGRSLAWFARTSPTTTDDREIIRQAIERGTQRGLVAPPSEAFASVAKKGADLVARGWRYSRMISEARRSRVDMVYRLDEYAAGDNDHIDLYVPLCVDMEFGAREASRSTPLEQFDTMSYLSEASLRGALGINGIVLPMVGYDPHRERFDARSDLEQVKQRVRARQAFGVKLYPPMGFKPLGNRSDIDERLNDLYTFCEELDVPITAHCSPANAVEGAECHAHPEGWRAVLRDHPRLRLNLAHVGGLGEDGWALKAIALVAEHVGTDALVTADISNHDLAQRDDLAKFLKDLEGAVARSVAPGHDSPVLSRLIFGTDYWFLHMHRHPEKFLENYRAAIHEHFGDRPDVIESIFGGAALAFLGLNVAGNKNRQRLLDKVAALPTEPGPPPGYANVVALRPLG